MEGYCTKTGKTNKKTAEVNISEINRHTSPDEMVLVPGKVLGNGILDHKVKLQP